MVLYRSGVAGGGVTLLVILARGSARKEERRHMSWVHLTFSSLSSLALGNGVCNVVLRSAGVNNGLNIVYQ